MRPALLVLAVLAALLVAADFAARELAEAALARELASSLELSARPEVSLGGFPFIPRAVAGEIPAVEMRSGRATSGGMTFSEIILRLVEVEFSVSEVVSGHGTIQAGSGRGTARVSAIDVDASLAGQDARIEVRFHDGVALVASPLVQGQARSDVTLVEGELSFDSPVVAEPLRLRLPELFDGIRYESLSIDRDAATLTFTIRDATIELASGTAGGLSGSRSHRPPRTGQGSAAP